MKIYHKTTMLRTLYVECHQGFTRKGKCKKVSDLADLETIDQFFYNHIYPLVYVFMEVHRNKIFFQAERKNENNTSWPQTYRNRHSSKFLQFIVFMSWNRLNVLGSTAVMACLSFAIHIVILRMPESIGFRPA